MRYSQVRNMLDQVRDFRGQLADYFNQLSDESAQQRVKLLLNHIARHEKDLQESMAAYEGDAPRQAMDTYLDCQHCNEILATCQKTPIAPKTTVEDVITVALDVDACLLRFYREVADIAESETVREVFRNLIDMEEAELRRLALDALGASDI